MLGWVEMLQNTKGRHVDMVVFYVLQEVDRTGAQVLLRRSTFFGFQTPFLCRVPE